MGDNSILDLKVSHETWEGFGKNLEDYIASHKAELENELYDIILAFSRGGTILALAFACLLKDNSSEYSKPHKASVRPIPKGTAIKIDDPCFVMDHPASRQEKDDIIKNLKDDLEFFSNEFNDRKPISVLVMDDNLTGATRVKFLEAELAKIEKTGLVTKHRTLSYVRHKAFLETEIPTIISFPKETDIFVMPWHVPHSPRDLNLKDNHPDLVKLIFRIKLKCSFKDLIEKTRASYGFDEGFIINGASNFFAKEFAEVSSAFAEISHFPNKFYPPKICLASNDLNSIHSSNEFHPLCFYGVDDKTIGACYACSCLNCNKRLIEKIISDAKSGEISVKTVFRVKENLNLKHAIEKWFAESMPDVLMT